VSESLAESLHANNPFCMIAFGLHQRFSRTGALSRAVARPGG
jgi:hypothetical protein